MHRWRAVLLIAIFVIGLAARLSILNQTPLFPQGLSQTAQLSAAADYQGTSGIVSELIKVTRGKRKALKDFAHEVSMELISPVRAPELVPQEKLDLASLVLPPSPFSSLPTPPPSLLS
jgi:hypothetical protein